MKEVLGKLMMQKGENQWGKQKICGGTLFFPGKIDLKNADLSVDH